MIQRIYILCLITIIKSEVWTTTHCLGLDHETMLCAVCISVFLSINLNPSMDKYFIPIKVWDEITYPFLNFNGGPVEV